MAQPPEKLDLQAQLNQLQNTNEFLKLLQRNDWDEPAVIRPFVQKRGELVRALLRHPELIK